MSWRTLRLLAYIGLWCLVLEGITITAIVMAALTWFFSEPFWTFCCKQWTEFWRERLFKICFTDLPPPKGKPVDTSWPHPIPLGESEHFLSVRCNEGHTLNRFNIRFIDLAELSSDPADGIIDIQSTIKVTEVRIDPSDIAPPGKMRSDLTGGVHFIFNQPFDWLAGKTLGLRVSVHAENKEWSGKISFEAADPTNTARNDRRDVRIDPGAVAGPHIPIQFIPETPNVVISLPLSTLASDFIPMKEAATIAYEQLRECGSVYARAADKLGHSSTEPRAEGTLDWFVYFLPSRISLFGKHPPSRKQELIDSQEFKRGGFNNLGESFSYFSEREPRYIDLMVKRSDLNELIESLRKEANG